LEKYHGLEQNQRIGQGNIHSCGANGEKLSRDVYLDCPVCAAFGVPGERAFATPTRLIVRDTMLTDASAEALTGKTDLPFSEVKTEVSIDRVTSAANPRQMERVPAGAVFGPAELIYSLFGGDELDPEKDLKHLQSIVEGLALVQDDYLGGLGSRGSGKVKFTNIELTFRPSEHYIEEPQTLGTYADVASLSAALPAVQEKIRSAVLG
jgi:CRISPR-associated protein Csm3